MFVGDPAQHQELVACGGNLLILKRWILFSRLVWNGSYNPRIEAEIGLPSRFNSLFTVVNYVIFFFKAIR
jgi:hypothetical protein